MDYQGTSAQCLICSEVRPVTTFELTFCFFLGKKGIKGGRNVDYVLQSNGEEGLNFHFITVYSESDCIFALVMSKLRYCPLGLYWPNSVVVMGGVF